MSHRSDIRRIEISDDHPLFLELAIAFSIVIFITHIQAILAVISGYLVSFALVVFILYKDRERRTREPVLQGRSYQRQRHAQQSERSFATYRVKEWVNQQAPSAPAWSATPRRKESAASGVLALKRRAPAKTKCSISFPLAMSTSFSETRSSAALSIDSSGTLAVNIATSAPGPFDSPCRRRSLSAPATPKASSSQGTDVSSPGETYVASTPIPDHISQIQHKVHIPLKIFRDPDSKPSTTAKPHTNDSTIGPRAALRERLGISKTASKPRTPLGIRKDPDEENDYDGRPSENTILHDLIETLDRNVSCNENLRRTDRCPPTQQKQEEWFVTKKHGGLKIRGTLKPKKGSEEPIRGTKGYRRSAC